MPDLGIDKVLTFTVDPATAKSTTPAPATWSTAPGAGPRHMDFSPDGKHAYVVNELDNTVTACAFDAKDGTLKLDSAPATDVPLSPRPLSVKRLEWEHIQRVLKENGGNISATARALGIHRRTLQRKLHKKPVTM